MKRLMLTATILSLGLFIAPDSHAISDAQAQKLIDRIEKLEKEVATLRSQQKRAPVASAAVVKAKTDEQQNQEIALLKRQREVDAEIAAGKAEKQADVSIGKKGLEIVSADKQFSLSVKGLYQIDSRNFLNDDAGSGKDDILARRLRPIIEGKAFGDFTYRLMPDFAGSSTSARIFDAHIDYVAYEPFKIRVGKFKPPVSIERLQSAADLSFIERGHSTNLAPNRDVGIQAYGELIPETLEYQIGVFNGIQDLGNGDTDDDDKKDVVARIFTTPFRKSDMLALQGLGFGIAGSVGDREGSSSKPILPEYKTPGQQSFFKYRSGTLPGDTTFASGRQYRIYPQAYWYIGNIGILGEYAVSSQEITRGASKAELDNTAYQFSVSYVLTGEDVNYKGAVKPAKPFSIKNGGWGAFELVGRLGATEVDENAFPFYADITKSARKAQSYGTGLNWFFNENVSLMTDYEYTTFDGGATLGRDRPEEQAILTRVQLRF